jgi:hypothetical protein
MPEGNKLVRRSLYSLRPNLLTRSPEEALLLEVERGGVSGSERMQLQVPIPVPVLLRREHATVVAVQGHGVLVWSKQRRPTDLACCHG